MTVLHVNGLCLILGTTCHTLTMVKAFPEHRHVVAFSRRTPGESAYMLEEFKRAGAEVVLGSGTVNRAIVNKYDPDIIILNNEWPEFLDQQIRAELALKRVLVSYSHDRNVGTPSTVNIWNSKFTMKLNKGEQHDTPTIVMGSYIDTEPFAQIERDYSRTTTVGMLTTGPRRFEAKLSSDLITLFMRMKMRRPELQFVIPNANKLLAVPEWCATPDYTNSSVEQFYSDIDIFVHYTKKSSTDGWGRPVTEAMAAGLPVVAENRGGVVEQIDHRTTGYLADTEEAFINYVSHLCNDCRLRQTMGTAARQKACEKFGIPAIRDTLRDVFEMAEARHQDRRT